LTDAVESLCFKIRTFTIRKSPNRKVLRVAKVLDLPWCVETRTVFCRSYRCVQTHQTSIIESGWTRRRYHAATATR